MDNQVQQQLEQALAAARELGDRPATANALAQLSALAYEHGALDQAAEYGYSAVEILVALDTSAEPWHTYSLLFHIAVARGRASEAVYWRQMEQDTFFDCDEALALLPGWAEAFIAAAASAALGDRIALREVQGVLDQMATAESWQRLPPALRAILAGERDFEMLRSDLEFDAAYIVRAVLARLATEFAVISDEDDDGPPVSLDEFIKLVGQACQPDAPAEQFRQFFNATLNMTRQPQVSPEVRALGRVLHAILTGERQPDLASLPTLLAAKVARWCPIIPTAQREDA